MRIASESLSHYDEAADTYHCSYGAPVPAVTIHDVERGLLVRDYVAAVSVGVYRHVPVLDLDYAEDSTCETDMNVVMTGRGGFVEVQGTAEGEPFTEAQMAAMMALARKGVSELIAAQKHVLGEA